jgi:hypothetical protein
MLVFIIGAIIGLVVVKAVGAATKDIRHEEDETLQKYFDEGGRL